MLGVGDVNRQKWNSSIYFYGRNRPTLDCDFYLFTTKCLRNTTRLSSRTTLRLACSRPSRHRTLHDQIAHAHSTLCIANARSRSTSQIIWNAREDINRRDDVRSRAITLIAEIEKELNSK